MTTKSESDDVFEVERVRQLVELMKEHDLSEIKLREADKCIKLRRGDASPPTIIASAAAPAVASAPMPAAPLSAGSAPAPAAAPAATAEDDANIVLIKSPMVGTFYARPKPGAENFVKVGDHVSPESTVCIVEAMKTFNEIPADCTGQIVAVLVENEQPVDVDKPLFKVDTSK